jgi:hypothetical protein
MPRVNPVQDEKEDQEAAAERDLEIITVIDIKRK